MVRRGHEVASHGYDHTKVDRQSRAEFLGDVRKTKKLLEDISGMQIKGYRAAGFSIGAKTPWAYEALAEAGHVYSSSTHPIAHDHYGDAKGAQSPFRPVADAQLIEAPVATTDLFGRRVSAAGGGWFRAAPFALSRSLISKAATSLDGPVTFYFHPWEIDLEQPRMTRASAKSKLRHYLGLSSMEEKLSRLLSTYSWGRIDGALGLGGAA